MGKTTIQIDEETRRKLKIMASKRDQSYDQALEDLLMVFESSVPFQTRQEFIDWAINNPKKLGLTQLEEKEEYLTTHDGNTVNLELLAKDAEKRDLEKVNLIIAAYSDREKVKGVPVLSLVKHVREKDLKKEDPDKFSVQIPIQLADKVKETIDKTGFTSINEFITSTIRDTITSEDMGEARKKLRKLGYI